MKLVLMLHLEGTSQCDSCPFSTKAAPGPVAGQCLIWNQFFPFRQTKNQPSAWEKAAEEWHHVLLGEEEQTAYVRGRGPVLPWPNEKKKKESSMQNMDVKKQQWSVEDTNCLLVLWSLAQTQSQLTGATHIHRSELQFTWEKKSALLFLN